MLSLACSCAGRPLTWCSRSSIPCTWGCQQSSDKAASTCAHHTPEMEGWQSRSYMQCQAVPSSLSQVEPHKWPHLGLEAAAHVPADQPCIQPPGGFLTQSLALDLPRLLPCVLAISLLQCARSWFRLTVSGLRAVSSRPRQVMMSKGLRLLLSSSCRISACQLPRVLPAQASGRIRPVWQFYMPPVMPCTDLRHAHAPHSQTWEPHTWSG